MIIFEFIEMVVKIPPQSSYALRNAPKELQQKIAGILDDWPKNRKGKSLATYQQAIRYIITKLVSAWEGQWINPKEELNNIILQCKKGHQWQTQSAYIRRGEWCPICGIDSKRASLDSAHALAAKHHSKCLSTSYTNRKTKLKWQCEKGHIWESTMNNAYQLQTWCLQCDAEKKHENLMSEFSLYAGQRGGDCLSIYHNKDGGGTRVKFRCQHDHIWDADITQIRSQKTWCQSCSLKERSKYSLVDLHVFAAKYGGKCLAQEFVSVAEKVEWQCNKGHVWQSSFDMVLNGNWCRRCAYERHRLTIDEMQEIAHSRGGWCLSETYQGITVKLLWECHLGHTWWSAPANVKRGNWCPECAILLRCKSESKKRKYLTNKQGAPRAKIK